MPELEISIFDRGPEGNRVIRGLLNEFERKTRIQVLADFIPFRGGWAQLVNVALHHFGPDISEVGSTWVKDFVRMNAVEPFSPADIRQLGGAEGFLKLNWESGGYGGPGGARTQWAIPWSADVRAIVYRQDWVQKAGLNEKKAFSTPKNIEKTLEKFQTMGIEMPLALPTLRSRVSIHNLASFIWGAGGDFFSPDGKELWLNHPKTRQGFRAYFNLGQFIPPSIREAEEGRPEQLFYAGRVGMLMTGYWTLRDVASFPAVQKHIGTVPIPGVPFLGGLNLLIWKHTRRHKEAIQLIQYLTGTEISDQLFPMLGLPARLKSLEKPPFTTDPHFKTLVEISHKGRTLSSQHLWGLVENRLTDTAPLIWQTLFANPRQPIDAVLDQYLKPLSRRLEGALSSLE